MPEVGGKRLAGEFTDMLAQLRKRMDAVKTEVAGAVTEFIAEIENGQTVARQLREESAAMRNAFGEVLGNAPPEHAENPSPPAAPAQANGGG